MKHWIYFVEHWIYYNFSDLSSNFDIIRDWKKIINVYNLINILHTHTYVDTHTHICTYLYVCIYTHIHIHMCVYIYIFYWRIWLVLDEYVINDDECMFFLKWIWTTFYLIWHFIIWINMFLLVNMSCMLANMMNIQFSYMNIYMLMMSMLSKRRYEIHNSHTIHKTYIAVHFEYSPEVNIWRV